MSHHEINSLGGLSLSVLNLEALRRAYERQEKVIADMEATIVILRRKQFARELEIKASTERIFKAKGHGK